MGAEGAAGIRKAPLGGGTQPEVKDHQEVATCRSRGAQGQGPGAGESTVS